MRPLRREEILDLSTYERARDELRPAVMEAKRRRRVHFGSSLTLLFENAVTMRYQVQEMIRAERMVKEAEIQHELETYGELLGGPGELAATLLIEIPDPEVRDRRLREWIDLPGRVYLKLEDGERVRPRFDPRQVGTDRLSSVQYLNFDVKGRVPIAIGCDLGSLTGEQPLSEEQRAALSEDLRSDGAASEGAQPGASG
ncbi:MAG: DUF3501 family protein [Anaeromyxobacteraceae bacterium]